MDYTFYTHKEYRKEVVRQISHTKRGDRVLLMSMTFEPDEPEITEILQVLLLAASRGVGITFIVDAHTFMVGHHYVRGPLWYSSKLSKHMLRYYKNKRDFIQKLAEYPTVETVIMNRPKRAFSLPIAGRSHIKATIINDRVFLGGCNLDVKGSVDVMIGWRDNLTSDYIYNLLRNIGKSGHVRRALSGVDKAFSFDKSSHLFIDAGTRRQSLILDEALNLIDAAENWLVITCQFFPNSITAQRLQRARERGVDVKVIYAHPSHHGIIGGFGQYVSILFEKVRLPKSLFAYGLSRHDPFLHAKLIACDKGVMIGSHNYVTAGVLLGTAEIALKLENKTLAHDAVKALERALKQRTT